MKHHQFICPECGSYRWGTSNLNKPEEEWIGHCHGGSCEFTWKRINDDQVFVPDPAAALDEDDDEEERADHVVMDTRTNAFKCLHCGAQYQMNLPCPLPLFIVAIKEFAIIHAGCMGAES